MRTVCQDFVHQTNRDLKIKSLETHEELRKFARTHIGDLTSLQLFYLESRKLQTAVPIETRPGFNITPNMNPEDMIEGIKKFIG